MVLNVTNKSQKMIKKLVEYRKNIIEQEKNHLL